MTSSILQTIERDAAARGVESESDTFGRYLPAPVNEPGADLVAKHRIVAKGAGATNRYDDELVQQVKEWAGVADDPFVDEMIANIARYDGYYEEEASLKLYLDVYKKLLDRRDEIDTIVEVGCYLGGMTAFVAQIAKRLGFEYHVVDVTGAYLAFTRDRVAQIDFDASAATNYFHGSLPVFVDAQAEQLRAKKLFLMHDAAHDFTGVLIDLCAARFFGPSLRTMAFHDFRLRSGQPEAEIFVDCALYAAFGPNLDYEPIGDQFDIRTEPGEHDEWQLYFEKDMSEGVLFDLAKNPFRYPPLPGDYPPPPDEFDDASEEEKEQEPELPEASNAYMSKLKSLLTRSKGVLHGAS